MLPEKKVNINQYYDFDATCLLENKEEVLWLFFNVLNKDQTPFLYIPVKQAYIAPAMLLSTFWTFFFHLFFWFFN
jgi:hypothetical protein